MHQRASILSRQKCVCYFREKFYCVNCAYSIFNTIQYTVYNVLCFCVQMCIMLGLSLIEHHSPFMGETKGRIGNWNFLWGLGLGIGSGLIQQGLKFASGIRTQLFLHRSSFLF